MTHDLSCTKENHAGVRTSPETPDGNIFYPYWFRGSAGIVFALAKAYAVTEHSDVLDNIRILLPDVCRDITMFPGLFNGLAGIMVSLSSCAQYTGISTCYHFANRAREAISLFLVSEPEGYGVPSDYLIRMSNDLATGTAGVLLSLLHLSNASRCQDTYDDEFMIGTV